MLVREMNGLAMKMMRLEVGMMEEAVVITGMRITMMTVRRMMDIVKDM